MTRVIHVRLHATENRGSGWDIVSGWSVAGLRLTELLIISILQILKSQEVSDTQAQNRSHLPRKRTENNFPTYGFMSLRKEPGLQFPRCSLQAKSGPHFLDLYYPCFCDRKVR